MCASVSLGNQMPALAAVNAACTSASVGDCTPQVGAQVFSACRLEVPTPSSAATPANEENGRPATMAAAPVEYTPFAVSCARVGGVGDLECRGGLVEAHAVEGAGERRYRAREAQLPPAQRCLAQALEGEGAVRDEILRSAGVHQCVEHQVARHREAHAPGGGDAIHRGDDGLGRAAQLRDGRVQVREDLFEDRPVPSLHAARFRREIAEVLRVTARADVLEVGPAAEDPIGAPQHHAAHGRISRQLQARLAEITRGLHVERVEAPVDRW